MSSPSSNRAATGCCLGCFSVAAASAGLLTLLMIFTDTGSDGLMGGMLLACLPVPFYTGLALWLDRYEPEPPLLLFGAFLWGATFATFASYILNTFNSVLLIAVLGDGASSMGAYLSAPWVEESAKGLGLLILFLWKKDEFDGIVDGVVYATMVALGFAMTENIAYYGRALHEGGGGAAGATFILRGLLSPYSHPLFTCMTGIGLGWARQTDKLAVKILAPLGGLMMAMGLHALWNLTATIDAGLWLLSYLLIMAPTGLTLLIVVAFALAREGNLIKLYLQPEVDSGQLSAQDLASIVSVPGRIMFSLRALGRSGPRGWWNAERFLHNTSELAFLRHRVKRGLTTAEAGAELESGQFSELFSQRKF